VRASGAVAIAAVCALAATVTLRAVPQRSAVPVGTGTIRGHVRLSGAARANPVIRMGMDPACAVLNQGHRLTQDRVLVRPDGALANVFVSLQGQFVSVPPPTEPVVVEQRGCVFIPRVAGARVGQFLEVRNSDNVLHNVRSASGVNPFSASQATGAPAYRYRLTGAQLMMRVQCDIHGWMTSYIGVVDHPFFSVTSADGTFEIVRAPAGDYTVHAWHEEFGEMAQRVHVTAGQASTIELIYSGAAHIVSFAPPAASGGSLLTQADFVLSTR
jgi:hypothetical protein